MPTIDLSAIPANELHTIDLRGLGERDPAELDALRARVELRAQELHADEHGSMRDLSRGEQAEFDALMALRQRLEQHARIRDAVGRMVVGRNAEVALGGQSDPEDRVSLPLSARPLRSGESMLERCTKAAGRGAWPDDDEWRAGLLGALALGDSRAIARYGRYAGDGFRAMDTSGASVIVPTPIAASLIDRMRAASVTQRLGAQTVPMTSLTLRIPRLTGDPTVGWLAENATVTATDATMDSVTLTARRLTGLTLVSQELFEDSDPVAVGTALETSFGGALATELDRVTLKGSGTAPEPRGIRNQTGVSVNSTAAASTWSVLTERVGVLLAANVPMERIGVAVNTTSWSTLFAQVATGGDWIAPPYGMGADRILSTSTLSAPATGELYAGDFTEAMLGVRVALDFQTLRERFADSGQVGFLPRVRADVAVRHGQSFAVRTALSS